MSTKYCPFCGSENDSANRFCANCGSDLDLSKTPAEQPVQTPTYAAPPLQQSHDQQTTYELF